MDLKDTIFIRKSTRAFLGEELSRDKLAEIEDFIPNIHPLDESIKTQAILTDKSDVINLMPWTAPHYACLFSETGWRGLIELGFRYQQLDLYLQSIGLGSCWLGIAKLKRKLDPTLDFNLALAFGKAKGMPHRAKGRFQRKTLSEISDRVDGRLEAARVAPSATNRQSWYFEHDGEVIHLFGQKGGYYRPWGTSRWLWIDMGIALCHLYLTHQQFSYQLLDEPPVKSGYVYAGTIRL